MTKTIATTFGNLRASMFEEFDVVNVRYRSKEEGVTWYSIQKHTGSGWHNFDVKAHGSEFHVMSLNELKELAGFVRY